jgi:hypothetical protein
MHINSRHISFGLAILLPLIYSGCSSPASNGSPESVRDPLGIDRAVNDYYFPAKQNETGDASGRSTTSEPTVSPDASSGRFSIESGRDSSDT